MDDAFVFITSPSHLYIFRSFEEANTVFQNSSAFRGHEKIEFGSIGDYKSRSCESAREVLINSSDQIREEIIYFRTAVATDKNHGIENFNLESYCFRKGDSIKILVDDIPLEQLKSSDFCCQTTTVRPLLLDLINIKRNIRAEARADARAAVQAKAEVAKAEAEVAKAEADAAMAVKVDALINRKINSAKSAATTFVRLINSRLYQVKNSSASHSATASYSGPDSDQFIIQELRRLCVRCGGVLQFKIAGRQYHLARVSTVLRLMSEPHNAHDRNAIAILNEDGNKVGYVPAIIVSSRISHRLLDKHVKEAKHIGGYTVRVTIDLLSIMQVEFSNGKG